MSRKNVLTAMAACVTTGLAVIAGSAGAATVTTAPLTGVAGAAPVLLRGATDLGRAPQRMEHATLALALRDRLGLDALIAAPGHRNLTPSQFTERFGPSNKTTQAAEVWAHTAGLTVTGVSPNRTLVSVSGSTAMLDRAFGTSTHLFRAGSMTYRSVSTTAALPASLAGAVVGVTGLSDLGVVQRARKSGAAPLAVSFPQTFGPKELAAFYDAPAGGTGAGQTVGVIAEGQLGQVITDLRTFESTFGLPAVPVTTVGPGSADVTGQDEYDLDTQYATGEAPGVAGLRIYDGASLANSDILSTINRWATEGTVKTASFSAGECELLAGATGFTTSLDQVLAQAAVQGQSLFVSSGDNGNFCSAFVGINGIPAGIPSVEYPASSPYAVGVGGTTVTGALPVAGNYTAEAAWIGGGGGLSYFEDKPAYQSSLAPLQRGVPDVALDADPLTGFKVIVSGKQLIIGGTSASAPAWNGFWARALGARGALGFAGPRLYGAKTGFHDVVVGSNGVYPATPGYDYTTGLGTPDLARLIPAL